jgi:hypothetical protein
MNAEDIELLSSDFLSTFNLGKLKKGAGFNENHEYDILMVLNRYLVR